MSVGDALSGVPPISNCIEYFMTECIMPAYTLFILMICTTDYFLIGYIFNIAQPRSYMVKKLLITLNFSTVCLNIQPTSTENIAFWV